MVVAIVGGALTFLGSILQSSLVKMIMLMLYGLVDILPFHVEFKLTLFSLLHLTLPSLFAFVP